MLTIPAAVETLFKTDGIRKEFRVHFPNGEHADLTNSDIVDGSVQFSESICSSDTLKFGAAEASSISFECANIPNIYGCTIECSIEIDTDSIVPGTVYPVKLGTFIVTSCPRNAGAMYRRKVQAYTFGGQQLQPSGNAQHAINFPTSVNPITIYLVNYLRAAAQTDFGLTVTPGTALTLVTGARLSSAPTWTANGHTYTCTFAGNNPKYAQFYSGCYRLTCESVNASVYKSLFDKAAELGATNEALKNLRLKVLPGFDITQSGTREFWNLPDPSGSNYDSGNFFAANGGDYYVFVPDALTVDLKEDGTTIATYSLSGFQTNVSVKPQGIPNDPLLSKAYAKIEPSFQDSVSKMYMYLGAVDFPALYEGLLELLGSFGRVNRSGQVEVLTLSKSSPVSIAMSEYAADGCWWDEYSIEPIGTVRYTYHDADEDVDQTVDYHFGDGLSVYDMTDNAFLKALSVTKDDLNGDTLQDYIEDLLDAYFIPNVQDIAFVPVDLQMLGLPYLEAGDYLVFDVGGGETIGTYIMSRTMSGVQLLMDDVQSQGGEIINSEGRNV